MKDTTYKPGSNYRAQGGTEWVLQGTLAVKSGAVDTKESGSTTTFASGAVLNLQGTTKFGSTTMTATGAEINTLAGQPSSMSLVTTHAGTGTLDVSITLKDASGATLDHAVAGIAYLASDAAGLLPVAATLTDGGSGAVLQSGNGPALVSVTTAGALQLVAEVAAGTRYLVFVGPDGRPIVSSALVAN